jgi:hypothetical protein
MHSESAVFEAATGPGREDDYVLWATRQAELLRSRQFHQLDLANLIDDVEDAVRHVFHPVEGRLRVLITHLLKCQFQPARKSHGWECTRLTQRMAIARLLKRNPSLRPKLLELADGEYARAVRKAMQETRLRETAFPRELPYTAEQLLDYDFEH